MGSGVRCETLRFEFVEHYADGDLVNCHNSIEYGIMGKEGAIWGAGAPDFRPRNEVDKAQLATLA